MPLRPQIEIATASRRVVTWTSQAFGMRDQIEAVEQHHRDEPQYKPRQRYCLLPRILGVIGGRSPMMSGTDIAEGEDRRRK
jgi:hypothetical protein